MGSLCGVISDFFITRVDRRTVATLSLICPIRGVVGTITVNFKVKVGTEISCRLNTNSGGVTSATTARKFFLSIVRKVLVAIVDVTIVPMFLRVCARSRAIVQVKLRCSAVIFLFSAMVTVDLFFRGLFRTMKQVGMSVLTLLIKYVDGVVLSPFLV